MGKAQEFVFKKAKHMGLSQSGREWWGGNQTTPFPLLGGRTQQYINSNQTAFNPDHVLEVAISNNKVKIICDF